MRVKSWRIDSSGSASRKREPVGARRRARWRSRAAEQLQGAGDIDALAAREGRDSTARWRWPRRKFGTATVRSIAAFRVTVRIMGLACPGWPWWRRRGPRKHNAYHDRDGHAPAAIQTKARGPGTASSNRDTSDGSPGPEPAPAQQRRASATSSVHSDHGCSEAAAAWDRSQDLARGVDSHPNWTGRAGLTPAPNEPRPGGATRRDRDRGRREPLPLCTAFPGCRREPVAEQSKRVIVARRLGCRSHHRPRRSVTPLRVPNRPGRCRRRACNQS